MAKKVYFSNEEKLQQAKVLFHTLEVNTKVAEKLEEYGYSSSEIDKGKKFYTNAQSMYSLNKSKTEGEKIAYLKFKQKMEETTLLYKEHRSKAKLIFKENQEAKVSLSLKGSPSVAILTLLGEMETFYNILKEKDELKSAIQRVKITDEVIEKQKEAIHTTRGLYATYSQEKNESEQATKDKNKAFAELEKWVRELYSYAKFALSDEKQFLQIFGKIVP